MDGWIDVSINNDGCWTDGWIDAWMDGILICRWRFRQPVSTSLKCVWRVCSSWFLFRDGVWVFGFGFLGFGVFRFLGLVFWGFGVFVFLGF